GGDAVAPGSRPAPPPVRPLAVRPASADRTGGAAVPHGRCRLRPAYRDAADRGAVRRGPAGPAPGPQDSAQRVVLAGVRRTPARSLAAWLARPHRRRLDPGRHGPAGAGLLRQQVRPGAGLASLKPASLKPAALKAAR